MKHKELPWMLLPCAGFAIGALFLRSREKPIVALPPQKGPFSWRLMKASRTPLTPREVGIGFADKWTVEFQAAGAAPTFKKGWTYEGTWPQPQNLRLMTLRNGRETQIKLPTSRLNWSAKQAPGEPENGDFRRMLVTFLLPPVPEQDALLLKTELMPVHNYQIKPTPNNTRGDSIQGKWQPFSLKVRAVGEKVKLPEVSRYSPIQIEKTKITKFGPSTPYVCPVQVEVTARCTDEEMIKKGAALRFEMPRVIDDSGQEFYADMRGTSSISALNDAVTGQLDINLDTRGFYGPLLQKRKGRLWLESWVSVKEGWPRRIRVLLRGAPETKK